MNSIKDISFFPLESFCPTDLRGIAFDGYFFYFTDPKKSQIYKYNKNFESAGCIPTVNPYTSITYDCEKMCFYALSYKDGNRIYRLNINLCETDTVCVYSDRACNILLTGISDCNSDTLLVTTNCEILIVSKESGKIIDTLKNQLSCSLYTSIQAINNGFFVSYINNYSNFIEQYADCRKEQFSYCISEKMRIKDMTVCYDCMGECSALYILALKHGVYPLLIKIDIYPEKKRNFGAFDCIEGNPSKNKQKNCFTDARKEYGKNCFCNGKGLPYTDKYNCFDNRYDSGNRFGQFEYYCHCPPCCYCRNKENQKNIRSEFFEYGKENEKINEWEKILNCFRNQVANECKDEYCCENMRYKCCCFPSDSCRLMPIMESQKGGACRPEPPHCRPEPCYCKPEPHHCRPEPPHCKPKPCPPPPKKGCGDIIQSIALIEASLSHILNAEGEKIQKVLETDDICKIIKVNNEVNKTITNVTNLEQLLYSKLELAKEICKGDCDDEFDCKKKPKHHRRI